MDGEWCALQFDGLRDHFITANNQIDLMSLVSEFAVDSSASAIPVEGSVVTCRSSDLVCDGSWQVKAGAMWPMFKQAYNEKLQKLAGIRLGL